MILRANLIYLVNILVIRVCESAYIYQQIYFCFTLAENVKMFLKALQFNQIQKKKVIYFYAVLYILICRPKKEKAIFNKIVKSSLQKDIGSVSQISNKGSIKEASVTEKQ